MPKNSYSEWDTVAANNTDIGGTNIAEACAAGNLNDALRKMMAQLAVENLTDFQPSDSALTSLAALGTAGDKGIYSTAVDTFAEFDLTAAGRALLDDADADAQRTTLGLGTAAIEDVIDEDDMSTDSATRPPSQQSVKAYVDTNAAPSTTVQAEFFDTILPDALQTSHAQALGGSYSSADVIISLPQLGSTTATAFTLSVTNSGGASAAETISASADYSGLGDAPEIHVRLVGLKTGQRPYFMAMAAEDEDVVNGTLGTHPFAKAGRVTVGSLGVDGNGLLSSDITTITLSTVSGDTLDDSSSTFFQVIGYR